MLLRFSDAITMYNAYAGIILYWYINLQSSLLVVVVVGKYIPMHRHVVTLKQQFYAVIPHNLRKRERERAA